MLPIVPTANDPPRYRSHGITNKIVCKRYSSRGRQHVTCFSPRINGLALSMIIRDPVVIAVAEVRLPAVPESAHCYAANDGSPLPVLPALQYFGESLACI